MSDALPAFGETTFDVYLNGRAVWRNVPAAVWHYKLGDYQVLKKWHSYRERIILDRPLTPEEVQHLSDTARRIAVLDRNKDNFSAVCARQSKLNEKMGLYIHD